MQGAPAGISGYCNCSTSAAGSPTPSAPCLLFYHTPPHLGTLSFDLPSLSNRNSGLSKKKWTAPIILNLQVNSNLLKFKYEQRRKR